MKLDQVQISHFRNISQANFSPSHNINIITGKNGSGKSSLLESLYYLGYGRSFRTAKHTSVINRDSAAFSVFCKCSADDGVTMKVGLTRDREDKFQCSIDGQRSGKLATLVSLIPIQLFTPQSTDLLVGSPSERRRFCDWGLFHVEQSFNQLSGAYTKVLKQRNALLKSQANLQAQENAYWDNQLCILGERISEFRRNYIEALTPVFEQIAASFLSEFTLSLSYVKGWEKDLTFAESLVKKQHYDGKIGHTSTGPHKADVRLKVNGVNAGEVLSRGQLRMAVAALQLSQTILFNRQTGRKSIFLLDDIGAELDIDKRERFVSALLDMDTQLFITAIEKDQLNFLEHYQNKKMFHVEHGHVNEEFT